MDLSTTSSHIKKCSSLCVPAHSTSSAAFLGTWDCARARFPTTVALLRLLNLILCFILHSEAKNSSIPQDKTFSGKLIPYQALLSRLYADLGVKNLMITLAHPLIIPLHQPLGLHHWGGLPFRHIAQSLPKTLCPLVSGRITTFSCRSPENMYYLSPIQITV